MVEPITDTEITDQHPELSDLRAEVIDGLSREPKSLPPKLFYDETGSHLFEEITELEEYYPTRTEIAILERHSSEITADWDEQVALIELGSGSSRKIRILFDAWNGPLTYMPIDISKHYLQIAAESIQKDYPHLEVVPVCSDYTTHLDIPRWESFHRRVLFFPGSTVGNFEPDDAKRFLSYLASRNTGGDRMIIGVDLEKDARILNAAYNDAKGVTAAFNLNILRRINRELGANFDLEHFEHRAFFNAQKHRVEMHLVSAIEQRVTISHDTFTFAAGETIHTENSYKYSMDSFNRLVSGTGFRIARTWTDEEELFSVHELEVA